MDCPMKAKCKAHFRRGEAACANCTSDDPQRFETDTAILAEAAEEKRCPRRSHDDGCYDETDCRICDERKCPGRLAECEEDKTCARGLRVSRCGPRDCESCDQPDCEDRCADFLDDDNVDADGHGDGDYVEDEYGNEGLKLFDVTVVFERSQICKKTYRIAADSEEEAKNLSTDVSGDEDYEELEWEDQGDGTTDYVDEVVEVED